jgi:hypothetical protein
MAFRKPRIIRDLEKLNPELNVIIGRKHLKLVFKGRMVGIYPITSKYPGLALNTQKQLRDAGVILPDSCGRG